MSKRTNNRRLLLAIEIASLSALKSHRVGAVIFNKKRLASIGWNQKKTHPRCNTKYTQHAEFNACIKIDNMSNKHIIYIARITRTGRVGMAKPCKYCQDFLQSVGIKKIFYTNEEGQLSKL